MDTITLPMDIIMSSILSKLPVKSLFRFKCISKSFRDEISSPEFIKLHHNNALSFDTNRLLISPFNKQKMCISDLDNPCTPTSTYRYPNPFTPLISKTKILSSSECYLLIGYNRLEDLILLNPSTRTYLKLPTLDIPYDDDSNDPIYGMCHCIDKLHDDFKVVRFRELICEGVVDDYHREIMIYSSKTNSWKLIECKSTVESIISPHDNVVLVQNHLLHFMFLDVYAGNNDTRLTLRIGCFDIKAERWANDVILPDIFCEFEFSRGKPFDLGVLDEKLCFLVLDMKSSTYDLWVMKNYSVKESWVKLMSLGICNDIESPGLWHRVYHPIAYRNGSSREVLCRRDYSGELFWYNLRNNEVIEVRLDGVPNTRYSLAFVCKPSLLRFPAGIESIKASSNDIELWDEDEEEEDDDI